MRNRVRGADAPATKVKKVVKQGSKGKSPSDGGQLARSAANKQRRANKDAETKARKATRKHLRKYVARGTARGRRRAGMLPLPKLNANA